MTVYRLSEAIRGWRAKRVLVIGASMGIGLATAQRFASEGAKVAFNYYRADFSGEREIATLRKAGHRIISAPGDPTSETSSNEMIRKAIADLGGLDIIIANADAPEIPRRGGDREREWRPLSQRITANFATTFKCVTAASSALEASRGVAVVAASLSGKLEQSKSVQDAARDDLALMIGNLSRSLTTKIRVNAVAAGRSSSERVSDAIWLLCSSNSKTSGHIFTVDDGLQFQSVLRGSVAR